MNRVGLVAAIVFALFVTGSGYAQVPGMQGQMPVAPPGQPQEYEILGISVEGVESENTKLFLMQTSGLVVGQKVTIPADEAFGEAIRQIHRRGAFSDIRVGVERVVGDGVFLMIHAREAPVLADFRFEGISRGQRDELRKQAPLLNNRAVKTADIERTKQIIDEYYAGKGFKLATVEVEQHHVDDNRVELVFKIDRGPRVEIGEVIIAGNEAVSDRRLQRRMKDTKERRWWRFWRKDTFDPSKFEEDLLRIVEYYNERGYYDARVVQDTSYVRGADGQAEVVVEVHVEEGPRYFVRNIEWEGNTLYTDLTLAQALGFNKGDYFNQTKFDRNLNGNAQSTDIRGLYMNQGYMMFNAAPYIQVVEGDSLDIRIEIVEGDVYQFGDIHITGNTRTKEHVIRREIRTIPGQTFSRDAIQRTIRELMQLNFFDPEKLGEGPGVSINEQRKTVDLTYRLEETSGDSQVELSGGWGGRGYGLMLVTRLTFNNFSAGSLFDKSAWRPLPMGDGQKLSLAVQVQGSYFQNYSLSFEEPWFRGRPTPLGFSLSHSRYDYGAFQGGFGGFDFITGEPEAAPDLRSFTTAAQFFYSQRLKWPDDFFQTSSLLGYRLYNLTEGLAREFRLPTGVSQELTFRQSLTRNSLDHPILPTSGSDVSLSLEVAPPLPGFIQYHKWRMNSNWNLPIVGKLALGMGADYGFIGSLTGGPVEFQRFLVGGGPMDVQGGYFSFGKDFVFARGYPFQAISPRTSEGAIGGTILNKYTSELRLVAIQSPQVTLAPYLFFDAVNTWDGFRDYNPSQLYRSAGVGARVVLPILGMVDLNYGYNFDAFPSLGQRDDGLQRWRFQFSLGVPLGK